ncbi:MAG: DegV family protein [Lacunisphaera sp.]|nr:DegV family protein [Lacunisphaera sp.]
MSAQRLSPYGLRRALLAGIQRVLAQREAMDRINFFPVADHDAGTNLAFTLGAVRQGLRPPGWACAGDVLRRVAADALDGARGNAGAILAQFFHGVAEEVFPDRRLTVGALAPAVRRGAGRARAAMAEPVEGTILSVIQAFADELAAQAEAGERDLRVGFQCALARARAALQQTTAQLKALRSAGVVDAGALGFVELLQGIGEFIEHGGGGGLAAILPEELTAAGVENFPDTVDTPAYRYTAQCVVRAGTVDRAALQTALRALPLSHLFFEGSRGQVRLHARLAHPAALFAAAARFGEVLRPTVEDTLNPAPRPPVAIVTDTGADVPAEAADRLDIHFVPQRLSIAGRDFIDGVSLSPAEFYHHMRTSPIPPRTSQPAPGDFRRMFEFLLTRHAHVIDVSLSRALSGTQQSAAAVAARTAADRITVFDTRHAAASQGLLAIWAAEAAQAGLSVPRILAGLERMRARTAIYAVIHDIRYGVRGGRVPRVAGPLTRLLRFSLMIRNRPNGRLGLMGGVWGRDQLPERFARRVLRLLSPGRRYRLIVGHGDCAVDAERVAAVLRASGREIDRLWVVETGIAVGAHAGPGCLVIGVQDYEPPQA